MNCNCRCTAEITTPNWDRKIEFCPLHASAEKCQSLKRELVEALIAEHKYIVGSYPHPFDLHGCDVCDLIKVSIHSPAFAEEKHCCRKAVEEAKDNIRANGIGKYEIEMAKADAYEDAAKIADEYGYEKEQGDEESSQVHFVNETGRNIADDIRARAKEIK